MGHPHFINVRKAERKPHIHLFRVLDNTPQFPAGISGRFLHLQKNPFQVFFHIPQKITTPLLHTNCPVFFHHTIDFFPSQAPKKPALSMGPGVKPVERDRNAVTVELLLDLFEQVKFEVPIIRCSAPDPASKHHC